MTCVAGLVTPNNQVYLGVDSLCTWGDDCCETLTSPKLFSKGSLLFGVAGDVSTWQKLQYIWTPPTNVNTKDTLGWIAGKLIPSLNEFYKTSEIEKDDQVSLLLACDSRLFTIGAGSVTENTCRYAAIGSGSFYALGSLSSTGKIKDPRHRIRLALQAAEKHCTSVRGPFIIQRA